MNYSFDIMRKNAHQNKIRLIAHKEKYYVCDIFLELFTSEYQQDIKLLKI